jgi:endoglucanase
MHPGSTRLLFASIALTTLAACQTTPPPATPAGTKPATPAAATASAPQAAAALAIKPAPAPAGQQVALGTITDQIMVDQVGYLPGHEKVALIAEANATSFEVVDVQSSTSVFSAPLGDPLRDADTGQTLRRADFSSLDTPGSYSVVVPGGGRSPEFRIDNDVYRQLQADALSSYEQLAVLAPGVWQTATAAERKTGQSMDVAGGWPDAGDYGRYMPTAATSLGTMLLLDDVFPKQASAQQLRVLRRELDWMLKMQRADGGVYHKVTPLNFGGFDKSSDNVGGPMFVFDASTPDAAVFVAATAEASRVYKPSDPAYADRLLAAAEKSWSWLQANPKAILPAETEGTGAYIYGRDGSQRFWAAAELFKTTGDRAYADYVRTYLEQHPATIEPLSWQNPGTYGLLAVALNDAADAGLRDQIVRQLSRWADGMTTTVSSPANPWATSISSFHWASNKTSLDNAVLLLIANAVSPKAGYVEAALDQLHFVLGRNALAKSFVTGYGASSVKNPHNRTMFALGRLVPGVLVGGPNSDGQDGVTPPSEGQRSYIDQLQAYASNENSIEYNAPLVVVTALFAGVS